MYLDEQKSRQGRDADAGSVCRALHEGSAKMLGNKKQKPLLHAALWRRANLQHLTLCPCGSALYHVV